MKRKACRTSSSRRSVCSATSKPIRRKSVQIVLSGQPELADRLNEPSLRQLKQRVALRCELKPLTLDEVAAYISGRLRIAGGAPEQVFTAQAVRAIYKASGGIPRLINVLCDNALVSGFALAGQAD